MDFATLTLGADTRGLREGEAALDRLGDAAERTEGKAEQLGDGIEGAGQESQRASRSFNAFGGAMGAVATAASALAATLASGAFLRSAITEATMFETTMLRVGAVIDATNAAAGLSAGELREQARQLAFSTLESTEGILEAQSGVLTFRNVQGEVFERAIDAATDLTAAMGGSMSSAAVMLGRALEDPVRGLTALTRTGTVFTEEQRDMVPSMVEAGNIAEAQGFILILGPDIDPQII